MIKHTPQIGYERMEKHDVAIGMQKFSETVLGTRNNRIVAILQILLNCAAITAVSASIGCERKAEETQYTEGRKFGGHAKMSKEEALRMLWGDNERIHQLDTGEAFPPYTDRLTPLQIFSAAKIVQGGDLDAPAIREISRRWGYQYMYFDENGKNVFGDHYFLDATPFHEGLAVIKDNLNNSDQPSYYYINRDGANIFDINGFRKALPFADGIALVSRSGTEYYFINKSGVNIFKQEYKYAEAFSEGFALVSDEQVYFINRKGEKVFRGNKFESAKSFNDGFAAVYGGGKWRYINSEGANAFGGKEFSKADSFTGGFAQVTVGYRPFVIDKSGVEVK